MAATSRLRCDSPRPRRESMKIALGADSAGKPLLDVIAAHLKTRNDLVVTDLSEPGYYADTADRVAKSNNAQIITMGARVIGPELAKSIVDVWLAAQFDPNGPSAGNVEAIG